MTGRSVLGRAGRSARRASRSTASRLGRSAVGASVLALGLTIAAAPAYANAVSIGNGVQLPDGSYRNAQTMANNLTLTSITVVGQPITIVDPIDLSTSTNGNGTPLYNVTLVSPICNIDHSINMAPVGNLYLQCATLNLNAPITSGGTLIDPSRVISTATQVNVLGNAASIQQALDASSSTTPPTVHVSPGQYAENLTIAHPLTLTGDDGSAPSGAGPGAPTIVGMQPGGNVVTVGANNVTVDGLHLSGAVDGGSSTASVDGVYASGVDVLTVTHNTIHGFSGTGIATPGSTNVVLSANDSDLPASITSTDASVFTEAMVGTFTVTSTGVPTAALSENGPLPTGVTFTDNGDGTATMAGIPATGTAGSYPLTITAANGVGPGATQNFTLTVSAAPHITSTDTTTFTEGSSGTFTVSASGSPTPSLSESGGLPPNVTFTDNGNGSATLAGTPTPGTAGSYPITITASNGVATDAAQPFTLTVAPLHIAGGTVTLGKATALRGHYLDKVSGSGWGVHGDTSVTIHECATSHFAPASCDNTNAVSVPLGTGPKAGKFSNALLTVVTGAMDTDNDTCGLATSSPCYLVVVGNTGDQTSSVALGFTAPSLTVKKTTGVLGNYVDGLKATAFPVGDSVIAEECDASVTVPNTVAANCDASTQILGTVATSGKVAFAPTGVTLRVGEAYSDPAAGTCAPGGTCQIVVVDTTNPSIALSASVGVASPTATAKNTTAVIANTPDKITVGSFPIGDTITARECDATVDPASTLATHCDPATVITGSVSTSGKAAFSPTGVTVLVGASYVESGTGSVTAGGAADIVVTDLTSGGISVVIPIAMAP